MKKFPFLLSILVIVVLMTVSGTIVAQDTVSARGFIEPPYFADRVASGELPPIDERIPEQPFVVGPGILLEEEYMTWEDGQYGGTINVSAPDRGYYMNVAGGATILRSPGQTTGTSLPNIVSAFSYSEDYTTFHFTIRQGLKWSDGEPVTTEDVRFAFEDLYQDPDVQRAYPAELYAQGNSALGPAQLTVIDELSFDLTFSQPYGFFVAALNSWIPYYDYIIKPAHYLKQFHAQYADPDTLAKLLEENNQTNWVLLLNSKDVSHWDIGNPNAVGLPVLYAWLPIESNDTRIVYERNPYFWHVDSSGHQLPYMDRIVVNIVTDLNAVINAVLAGQTTVASGDYFRLNAMPIFQQAAENNALRIIMTGSFNNPLLLILNQDYQYDDPNSFWQTLVADPQHRFGQALTAAINPDDINNSVYFGLYGASDPNYHYNDPALANELLDELGMDKRDASGYRLEPNGQSFILRITHAAYAVDFDPVAELLKQQLDAVGIHTEIERVDGSLFGQRLNANEIMASILWNDGPAWRSGMSRDYGPVDKGGWSPMTWLYFNTKGEQGRQPPAYIQQYYDLNSQRLKLPPESPEGLALFDQLSKWFAENYVFIPTAGARISPNVVDARLRNVPNDGAPVSELDTYINSEGLWLASQ